MGYSTFFLSTALLYHYTVEGARLGCTNCRPTLAAPVGPKLKITSQNRQYQNGYLFANQTDHTPIQNIPPFPHCEHLGSCTPMKIYPWMHVKEDVLNPDPLLLCYEPDYAQSSRCFCETGQGWIYLVTSGQKPDFFPESIDNMTFSDIINLLEKGGPEAESFLRQNEEQVKAITNDYFQTVNDQWRDQTGWDGKQLAPEAITETSNNFVDASLEIMKLRNQGSPAILPVDHHTAILGVPENDYSAWGNAARSERYAREKDLALDQGSTLNENTTQKIYSLLPEKYITDQYIAGTHQTATVNKYIKEVNNLESDHNRSLSPSMLLDLAHGKLSQRSNFKDFKGAMARIGIVAAIVAAPYAAPAIGYATTLATTYPGLGAMASGGLVSGLTSYARNTKPVYDANGQFSMLVTAWGTVGTDAGKGALSAGASNLVLTYLPPAINTGLDWLGNRTRTIKEISKLKNVNINNFEIKDKHLSQSTAKRARKFNVSTSQEANKIVREALQNGKLVETIPNGIGTQGQNSFSSIIDTGKIIGTKGETHIKIVYDELNNVWTVYPIPQP